MCASTSSQGWSLGEKALRNAHLHDSDVGTPWVSRDGVTPVLAAVIGRNGRWLICERPLTKRHGGLWEFPGGKLEVGESLADAARREVAEELGVTAIHIGSVLY